jgi:hypothetical protein
MLNRVHRSQKPDNLFEGYLSKTAVYYTDQIIMNDAMQKTVLSKIIAIFWEPSATFRFLLVKTSWLDVVVPVLLVILVTVASIPYVTPIALEDQKDRIAQSERLSDEQKAVFYDQINKQIGSPKAFILSPVVIIVRTALVAAILMFVSNFLFGGEVKYVGMLAVSAYGVVDLIASASRFR